MHCVDGLVHMACSHVEGTGGVVLIAYRTVAPGAKGGPRLG